MALRLGDTAPNFTAETTEGRIDFHKRAARKMHCDPTKAEYDVRRYHGRTSVSMGRNWK